MELRSASTNTSCAGLRAYMKGTNLLNLINLGGQDKVVFGETVDSVGG